MRIQKYFVSLFVILGACTHGGEKTQGSIIDDSPSKPLDGMIAISSTGKSVTLGSNANGVNSNAKPAMKVKFDYDFMLGEHEVTCGEVADLVNEQWGAFATSRCKTAAAKNNPIANVTFYDAVMFANAKSRAAHMDTVYSYTSATFNDDGNCTNMEGLSFNSKVDGYRLPTEAEWTLVASTYWNAEESWNNSNSGYKAHEVCSKRSGDKGFCDLAGNVMEWVNDWLGSFRDTTLTNYAGAPDGGTRGERVVKGGSFRSDPTELSYVSRGDVYTVFSSTKANYVGFRLAYGQIPNAVWMDDAGSAKESHFTIRASAQTIRDRIGTFKAKLAFRNEETGNLAYVDFSSGVLSVHELQGSIDAYHPDISPDGSKVAFCTSFEGLDADSKLYVRNLNSADGTQGSNQNDNLVKLDVKSAAIPRWRVTPQGDTVIVYVTNAGDNTDNADFKKASTWQVPFAKGKFGTPEKLFDGAYHGGVSYDQRLAVTGARRLRARVAQGSGDTSSDIITDGKDEIWYNEEQACNASLSKDSTKRTLFLDFASATGTEFVGESYRVHQYMLVADSTGKLVDAIEAPEGYTFDHSEWALSGNLAVASLTAKSGAHTKIVLVDFADRSITELVEGDDIWHPCLWVSENRLVQDDELDLDSAGVYLTEDHVSYQSEFRVKMELFWTRLNITEILVMGSSRSKHGVDPDYNPKLNMTNIGVVGADMNRDLIIAQNYALNHTNKLKTLVMSFDIDSWASVNDLWGLIRDGAPGYIYDENHNYWADSLPKNFVTAVVEAYPATAAEKSAYTERGGYLGPSQSWDSEGISTYGDSTVTDAGQILLDSYKQRIVDLVELTKDKGINLVGIMFPQAPQYKKTGAMGRCGMQRSEGEKVIAWLDSLDQAYDHFVFMDENKMGDHDYTDKMATNMDHLSEAGAKQLTERLIKKLEQLNR